MDTTHKRMMARSPNTQILRWVGLALPATLVLSLACVPTGAGLPVPGGLEFPFSLSVTEPADATFIRPGETVRIEWIDTGMELGALITLQAVSIDETGAESRVDILIGRDADSDADADAFDWNGTDAAGFPLPARSYTIEAVLTNPDGQRDQRAAPGLIVIPFTFMGAGPAESTARLQNNTAAGPFVLQDDDAEFIDAGVRTGDTLHVLGGSGSRIGKYNIVAVTTTTLTLATDAGDSGGEADVRYLVQAANPLLREIDQLVTIAWRDESFGPRAPIDLEVDPDRDPENGNAFSIRQSISLRPDGDSDRFPWDGSDIDGNRVPPGSYFVRATISPADDAPFSVLLADPITVAGVAPTISLTRPANDAAPSAGATLNIRWDDSDPDDDAQITLLIDPDNDATDPDHNSGNELVIEDGIDEDDSPNFFAWITAGFPEGSYSVVGRIEDAQGNVAVSSAPGRVTLRNSPPVLKWTRPEGIAADLDNNNGNGPFLLIDPSAGFSAGSPVVRNLVFAGNTIDITEGAEIIPGQHDIEEDPTTAIELTLVTDPGDSEEAGDVEYRITGDIRLTRSTNPLFDFQTHDPEESGAAFDLFLDFDTIDDNGNEIAILQNRSVPMNTQAQPDTFIWTGTQDVDLHTVSPGAYRLYAELDDGIARSPLPRQVFEGRVFVQTALGQPTVEFTQPASDLTPNPTQKITIDWTDEDTDDNTTITLRYDDDPMPNETVETGDPEMTIRTGIDADPDPGDSGVSGNPDRETWDWHPSEITEPAVAQGEYYLFAYIGNNGNPATNPDLIAVASATITLPNTPPELKFTTPGAANAEIPSPGGGNLEWDHREADGDTVTVDLWLDPDDNFSRDNTREIQIANNIAPASPFTWDGRDRFGNPVETGQYRLLAVLDDSVSEPIGFEAGGRVNFRPDANSPVILIASHFVDSSVAVDGQVSVFWRAIPVTGTEFVELYYDDDGNTANGLGTLIESNLPADANVLHSFIWELNNEVLVGTYFIHARLVDGSTQKDISTSQAPIDVNADNVTPTLVFLLPNANGVDTVSGSGGTTIAWEYESGQTGTITLEADPDDTVNNNNEILILNNRVQDPAPTVASDSFDWALQDTGGTQVPTGIYVIRGSFAVTSAINRTADGTVRVRKSASSPLVTVTLPTNNTNLIEDDPPNRDILINWEVDDIAPNGSVKVDIWFDRDPSPEAGAGNLAVGDPLSNLFELGSEAGIIVEDLDASQGVYNWLSQEQPGFLTDVDGEWHIHIRIRDGVLPADDDRATAVGKIRVN